MIRLIQRRLIIPRGDTGSFSISTIGTVSEGDIAIFGIFDPLTHKTLVMKKVAATKEIITISLVSEDTINLEPRKYNWDITIYKNPIYDEDNKLIGAQEVNSYYSAFKLPVCEITEVALDMNKDRWATAQLLLDTNQYQAANNIQTVYPWENIQLTILSKQILEIARQNGYIGDDKTLWTHFSGGVVNNGTASTFPIPGEKENLYIDTTTGILYYFKKTTEIIDEAIAEKIGALIVGTAIDETSGKTITYLYIPIRALPYEEIIYNCSDASDEID